ncbi:GDSL-type esterase/lipase family protein [Phytohabitans suffuscus]
MVATILSPVVVASIGMWPPAGAAAATRFAPAVPAAPAVRAAPVVGQDPTTVAPDRRAELLPAGWQRSDDLLWTTAGDSSGFHLLVAESSTGYTWRTAASLSEPGLEADQWIGNACLTGSGGRAVVVYAPRHFTNQQQTFDRGGFVAVVNLADGTVTKLAVRTSLAYYNPGCGAGEVAVLTQSGAVDLGRTRLHLVDTAKGSVVRRHELPGQVTSAVPAGAGVLAAGGGGLIEVAAGGSRRQVVKTRGTPFDLHPDRLGGLAFLERHGDVGVVRYLPNPRRSAVRELARGPLTEVGLAAGRGGQVFITGAPTVAGEGKDLPGPVRRIPAAITADVSTLGVAAVSHGGPAKAAGYARPTVPGVAKPIHLTARVLSSGTELAFDVQPGNRLADAGGQGRAASPAPGMPAPSAEVKAQRAAPGGASAAAASPTDPVDTDRTCAVPRNDARTQVEQPHWRQVEWAADLAVRGALTMQRPANWKQSGLPAWSPQGMFALPGLAGHPGARVPAAVLLGILAQESNLWQASWHVLEGETGNPLVGNFYGFDGSGNWGIRWSQADCGYGVAQVTDWMRLGQRPANEQRAIAVDYATNIAAGLQILVQKWNQAYQAGIHVNNGDPSKIENWFAAVWAYNTGMNPQASTGNTSGCTPGPGCTDNRGNWGLGWSNNPANPDYKQNRAPFLLDTQDDARNPQWWPYPEKVVGWAASPIVKYDFRTDETEAGYAQAWWTNEDNRWSAKPPLDAFCDNGPGGNRCDIDAAGNPCAESDFHCWWHKPVAWKPGCVIVTPTGTVVPTCGFDNWTFNPGDPEPPGGTHYPPVCTSTLPQNALIVDDVPDSVGIVRPDCPGTASVGTFSLQFGSDAGGLYPSKADLHQVGSGLDGHFYFAHTWGPFSTRHSVLGTWQLDRTWTDVWARVLVHLPGHGAHTQQAAYQVDTGASAPAPRFRTRYVNTASRYVDQNQRGDRWVSLGVFLFRGTPQVSLSNLTIDGSGSLDIAFDAVAFQPLPEKPRHFITVLGDSYTSGEGTGVYYREADNGQSGNRNACHRSPLAWSWQASLADKPNDAIGAREATFDPTLDYHMVACSGAQTEHLLPSDGTRNAWDEPARGSFGELPQVEQGYLDENTTLVALSIGGNDARWSQIIRFCATNALEDCDEQVMPGDTLPLGIQVPLDIRGKVIPSIETVLNKIHERAPHAKIVLMGYPVLVSGPTGACPTTISLSGGELAFTTEMAHLFADEMRELTERLDDQYPVVFADPRPDFHNKGVCGSPEAINGIVQAKTPGEDQQALISQQSFHPNLLGALLYRAAYQRALAELAP